MKNNKTLQEFPFTLKPATITGGAHAGKTEVHIRQKFTPAKMAGDVCVAGASVGTKHQAAMALMLFQKNASIVETEALHGPCVLRTAEGLFSGKLDGQHGTQDSICLIIAELKPLAGRCLTAAKLGATKFKLVQKYSRLAAKSGSQGRRTVLQSKALRLRTAAQTQWLKVFRSLAR